MALAFKNHLGWSQVDRSKYISWQLAGECISTCLDQISLPRVIYQLLYQHINCFIQFQLQKNPQNRRGSIRDVGFMFCFRRRRWLFIDFFGKRVYPNAFFFLNELYNFFNFFFCLLLSHFVLNSEIFIFGGYYLNLPNLNLPMATRIIRLLLRYAPIFLRWSFQNPDVIFRQWHREDF